MHGITLHGWDALAVADAGTAPTAVPAASAASRKSAAYANT